MSAFTSNWIISSREDLTWFIGSSLVSYAVLGLLAAGVPITPIYLIWIFAIDGPHVWATATRTYLDNQERRRLGPILWVVIPAMMVGPAMVAVGASGIFYAAAISWLHYHIAKQHFGFVMLYRAKGRDYADLLLDRWFLLVSLMMPFARFLAKTAFAEWFALPAVQFVDTALLGAYGSLVIVYIARQLFRWKSGDALNGPKLMLLAAVVPLQWLVFTYAGNAGTDGVMRAGICLGLFHSFQYHRLMWFHNHNRYPGDTSAGIAAKLAEKFVYYAAAAILLNLALQLVPALMPGSAYVKAAVWGVPFTHYILDSKIWRVRGNRELAAALKMA